MRLNDHRPREDCLKYGGIDVQKSKVERRLQKLALMPCSPGNLTGEAQALERPAYMTKVLATSALWEQHQLLSRQRERQSGGPGSCLQGAEAPTHEPLMASQAICKNGNINFHSSCITEQKEKKEKGGRVGKVSTHQ